MLSACCLDTSATSVSVGLKSGAEAFSGLDTDLCGGCGVVDCEGSGFAPGGNGSFCRHVRVCLDV